MQAELSTAIEAAQGAGEILLEYYRSDYEIKDKGYHNPVTTADYASNHHLEERLRDSYPLYGWLSEESVDTDERLGRQRVWVVDPLDGTKEFIEGVPQFVVSVALAENGHPALGVLHNPVTGETFAAAARQGATLNGVAIHCSPQPELAKAAVINSRSEHRRGLWEAYRGHFLSAKSVGSVAYKLGLVAAGKADFFATLRPKNEWDICAGHAILIEAGATLRPLQGDDHPYNSPHVLIRPGLAAGNARLVQAFLDLYQNNQE